MDANGPHPCFLLPEVLGNLIHADDVPATRLWCADMAPVAAQLVKKVFATGTDVPDDIWQIFPNVICLCFTPAINLPPSTFVGQLMLCVALMPKRVVELEVPFMPANHVGDRELKALWQVDRINQLRSIRMPQTYVSDALYRAMATMKYLEAFEVKDVKCCDGHVEVKAMRCTTDLQELITVVLGRISEKSITLLHLEATSGTNAILAKIAPLLPELLTAFISGVEEETAKIDLAPLAELTRLTSLGVTLGYRDKFTDSQAVRHLIHLHSLKILGRIEDDVTKTLLSGLTQHENLKEVQLPWACVRDWDLIAKVPALESLCLFELAIGAEQTAPAMHLTELVSSNDSAGPLSFARPRLADHPHLGQLVVLAPQLEKLHWWDSPETDVNQVTMALAGHSKMRDLFLELHNMAIEDEVWEPVLQTIPGLEKLNLLISESDLDGEISARTNALLEDVMACSALTRLWLNMGHEDMLVDMVGLFSRSQSRHCMRKLNVDIRSLSGLEILGLTIALPKLEKLEVRMEEVDTQGYQYITMHKKDKDSWWSVE